MEAIIRHQGHIHVGQIFSKKNNEQRTLEFLPIYMKDYVEQSEEKAQEYLVTNLGS